MADKILSHFVAIALFVGIVFNVRLTDSFFLSNIILLSIDTILLIKIISIHGQYFLKDVTPVFIVLLYISIVAIFSAENPRVLQVYTKLVIIVYTYYAFSRYFKKNSQSSDIILWGICLGITISPIFQVTIDDQALIGVSNRIKVDNLGNFNAYGFLLAISISVAFYLYITIRNRFLKNIFIATQLVTFFVLLLTFSRGGVFAVVLGALIIFYNSKDKKNKTIIVAGVLCLLVLILSVLRQFDLLEVFTDRFLVNEDNVEGFDSGRSYIYMKLLEDIFSSFLSVFLGFGLGSIADDGLQSAHNTYIDIFYYFGIIGLIGFLMFIYSSYLKVVFQPTSSRKILEKVLLCQVFFCFFYDSYWGATQTGWIFSIIFALFWGKRTNTNQITNIIIPY